MNPESGLLTMSADGAGLTLALTTRDPGVGEFDIWELFFDFRPRPKRYGLYGKGTFAMQVVPPVGGNAPAVTYKPAPKPKSPAPAGSLSAIRRKTPTRTGSP